MLAYRSRTSRDANREPASMTFARSLALSRRVGEPFDKSATSDLKGPASRAEIKGEQGKIKLNQSILSYVPLGGNQKHDGVWKAQYLTKLRFKMNINAESI